MFGTIIIDSYSRNEIDEMAKNLDEICCPTDTWGWASAGIYSFWDYYTKDILYIGLASDLHIRFKQHNGLLPIAENACKIQQINDYFSTKDRLGYSIIVQSPLSQPIVNRNQELYRKFLKLPHNSPVQNYAGEEGLQYIREIEGQLIESYKLITGDIPLWNKIGGDVRSRHYANEDNYYYVIKALSNQTHHNLLVSKSTIRELAESATYTWYETQLHGLRIMMIYLKYSFDEAIEAQLKMNPYFKGQWDRIISDKYLEKTLIV